MCGLCNYEIVVAVVPWPTETVCSRLVVAMCVCTRRRRWATTIPSRMTINIRGWSGGRHRKRLLKSRGQMEWGIIMLLRQGVVQSLSGKRWAAFGVKCQRQEQKQVPRRVQARLQPPPSGL